MVVAQPRCLPPIVAVTGGQCERVQVILADGAGEVSEMIKEEIEELEEAEARTMAENDDDED